MEKGAQPDLLGAGEESEPGEVPAIRQHGTKGDHKEIGECEANLAWNAGIVE